MDEFADLLEGNARYAEVPHDVAETGVARRGLAIVTCIDSRIDPLAVFGLVPGDAKILRNAGARVTPDVERSLALAVAALGVTRIAVVQHTECKLTEVDDAGLVSAVEGVTGRTLDRFDPMGIADQPSVLRADVDRLLESPLLAPDVVVAGFVLELRSGRLDARVPPRVISP